MRVKELRIGNWITFNGSEARFTILDFTDTYYNQNGVSDYESRIKPILLTKEWFDKFEFISNLKGWYHKPNDNICIFHNQMKNGKIHSGISIEYTDYDGRENEAIYDIEIKYVHQLQNMWYAITGEEL